MTFNAKTRYLLVTLTILTACVFQLVRGYALWIVVVGGLAFLIAGNAAVFFAGTRERAVRLQKKRDFYAGRTE